MFLLQVTFLMLVASTGGIDGATVKPKVLKEERDRKGRQMFDQSNLNLQAQQGLLSGQGGLGQQVNQFQNNPLLNLQAQLNNQQMQQAMLMNGGGSMNLPMQQGLLNNQPNLNLQGQHALLGNQQTMGLQGWLNPGLNMQGQMGLMNNQMLGMQGGGLGGYNRFNQGAYNTLLAQQMFHKLRLQTPGLMNNLHNLKLIMMNDPSMMQSGLGMGGQFGQQMNPQMMAQLLMMQNSGMNQGLNGGLNGGLNQGLGTLGQMNNPLALQTGLMNNPNMLNQLRMNNMNGVTGFQNQLGVNGLQGQLGMNGLQGQLGMNGLQGQLGMNGLQGQLGMNGLQGQLGMNGLQGQLGMNNLGMNYPSLTNQLMGRSNPYTTGSDVVVNNVVSRLPYGNSLAQNFPMSMAARQGPKQ